MKDLRGASRRNFLRLMGVAGAAFAIERAKVLDYIANEGGSALADECTTTLRNVSVIGGNGSFAWFQLLWPHLDVAASMNPAFAYHSFDVPGTLVQASGADHAMFYAPEAPWLQNGIPRYAVSAFMAGANETHTQTPTTAGLVANNASMLATLASIQRATPALLPVIGVEPVNFGAAAGAPSIATVPSANGMIELFNSQASQLILAAQKDKSLFETYYKAIVGLRAAAGRPTWTRHLETTKTAANLIGRNLGTQLTPTQADLDSYGVTALLASGAGAPAKDKLSNFARALITTAKAFKLGLTNSVCIGLSPGATSEQTFTDPHTVFPTTGATKATVAALGMILDGFYKDLEGSPDPACPTATLAKNTVFTVHGDTPHTPLQADAWPDATPGNSNWMYVLGNGYLRTGWFGGVHADGSTSGFDPSTGADVPGQPANVTTNAAGAAVAYAVAKGNMSIVNTFYSGPSIKGIVV
jgi:hypothetical protein